nr:MAG TPA: hypothetical protein [Caudoviricetes sp.]
MSFPRESKSCLSCGDIPLFSCIFFSIASNLTLLSGDRPSMVFCILF